MSVNYQAIQGDRQPALLTHAELAAVCEEWRRQGDRLVFTNGCFDVLHEGHLELLTTARRSGDRLIVCLNADEWITRHKGRGRPLQTASIRLAVAHCLSRADLSLIFTAETVEGLLAVIKPAVYLIGSDYRNQTILGAEHCGEVRIMERLPGVSTTSLIANASNADTVLEHAGRQPRVDQPGE